MIRKLQIGVIGSAGPDKADGADSVARDVGKRIAERGHVLVFGPELQPVSLSTLAAKAAAEDNGTTLAIALGRGRTSFEGMEYVSAWVYTDNSGGGGREVVLANSCDGVIVIGGGVGTLIEIAVSYMNLVPVVLIESTGGWADKLNDAYLDERRKVRMHKCADVEEAIRHIENATRTRALRTLHNK